MTQGPLSDVKDRPTRPKSEPRARPAQTLRVVLYVLLAASAVAALFVEPALAGAVARGAVSPLWIFLPLALFCVLFAGYVIDRWRLVARHRYPSSRAIAQTLFGLILASVLLSSTLSDYRGKRPQGPDRLLAHPDGEIRAAAVYALGFHGPSPDRATRVSAHLEDRAPEVRQAAAEVLSRWSRRPPGDVSGLKAWASALSTTSSVTEGSPDR